LGRGWAFGFADTGQAVRTAGRSLGVAAGATGVAGFADRFFFLTAGALLTAVFLATDRLVLRVIALFFFFATLVFLADAFFLAVAFFLPALALLARFVLRAPTVFFAVLRCFDFDFFAMDHSAVSGRGSGEE
jgi:hypothetical protein